MQLFIVSYVKSSTRYHEKKPVHINPFSIRFSKLPTVIELLSWFCRIFDLISAMSVVPCGTLATWNMIKLIHACRMIYYVHNSQMHFHERIFWLQKDLVLCYFVNMFLGLFERELINVAFSVPLTEMRCHIRLCDIPFQGNESETMWIQADVLMIEKYFSMCHHKLHLVCTFKYGVFVDLN